MKKGESLEQYESRAKAEAELPDRLRGCTLRLATLACEVRAMTEALRVRNGETNKGGERSGTLAQ